MSAIASKATSTGIEAATAWSVKLRELKEQLQYAVPTHELKDLLHIVADRGWNHEVQAMISPFLPRLNVSARSTYATLQRQHAARALKDIGMSAEDLDEIERAMGVDTV